MQKSLFSLLLLLLTSQIVWSQTEKQDNSKRLSDKYFILSCQPTSGGNYILNDKAIKLVKPKYPKELIAERKKGAVNVQILINKKGKVISVSAVSGYIGFHRAAEEAVKKSRFKRFIQCNKPVKVTGVIVYNFIPPE